MIGSKADFQPDFLGQMAIVGANLLTLVLPLVLVQLFDRVIPNNAHQTLAFLASILLCALLLEMVLRFAVSALMAVEGERFEVKTQERLIDQLLSEREKSDAHPDPAMHFEALDTIERVRSARVSDTRHTVFDLPFSILFLIAFWYVAPPLLIAMLGILGLALLGSVLTRRRALSLGEKRRDQQRRSLSLSMEILGGIEHLKGLRAEPFMLRRLERLYANTANTTEALVRVQSSAKVLTEVIAQATPLVIGLFGALAVIDGTITSGALAAAILLSGRIIQPFLRQQQVSERKRLLAPSLRTLEDILSQSGMVGPRLGIEKIDTVEMQGIRFVGRNGHAILNDLELKVHAGEVIAVTGESGSGKSVLLKLLSGRLLPTEGAVRINGELLHAFDSRALASQIGLLAQNPKAPSGTALDIVTGFAGRRMLPQVLPVAEELGVSPFFAAHPQGMMVNLGGAASRTLPSAVEGRLPLVATLARAPTLLLFDEANGSLDFESDKLLLNALKRRKGRIAMIIVTQRPSYSALADRKYSLENGKLEEINDDDFMKRITKVSAA